MNLMKRALLSVCWLIPITACARDWTSVSGDVAFEAELFGMNDDQVLLRRGDGELGIVEIDELSQQDREFLNSDEASAVHDKNFDPPQVWTTASGIELRGRIVDFTSRDVTIQRRRGHMYVNDRRLRNLPEFYRRLTSEIIEHFENVQLPNQRALQTWLLSQRGRAREFQVDGVVLETDTGDEYAIPFFSLSKTDQELLQPYWSDWLAWKRDQQAREDDRRNLGFRLQALSAAHLQNQQLKREIAQVDLKLQAVRAGITSLWEVTLYPDIGNPHPPMWVVAPGRNSEQAVAEALANHPGFVVGPVRRISR